MPVRVTADAAADLVAETLPQRVALISRTLVRQVPQALSRTELGLLVTLDNGPVRITELAAAERLAQPTVTLLVKGLEARGLVERRRDPADGRAVLVQVTDAGREAVERVRAALRDALRVHLAALSDEQVQALAAASDALVPLIEALEH
jgi:DNA-binding MarR family transcriptional regulator